MKLVDILFGSLSELKDKTETHKRRLKAVIIFVLFILFISTGLVYLVTLEKQRQGVIEHKLNSATLYYESGNYSEVLSLLLSPELSSNPAALNNLAYLYYRGEGVHTNIARAADYLLQANLLGLDESYYLQNKLCIDILTLGNGDLQTLANSLRRAYEIGDEKAIYFALVCMNEKSIDIKGNIFSEASRKIAEEFYSKSDEELIALIENVEFETFAITTTSDLLWRTDYRRPTVVLSRTRRASLATPPTTYRTYFVTKIEYHPGRTFVDSDGNKHTEPGEFVEKLIAEEFPMQFVRVY